MGKTIRNLGKISGLSFVKHFLNYIRDCLLTRAKYKVVFYLVFHQKIEPVLLQAF